MKHIELTTDTSKKEFKSVSVFKRISTISRELKISYMICTFGPQHGKFLYDSSGSDWVNFYNSDCVGTLGDEAFNLEKVAMFMNQEHGIPTTKGSEITSRITLVVPPVLNVLSQWLSIPKTTRNFSFFISPESSNGVHVRRYWCSGCTACPE